MLNRRGFLGGLLGAIGVMDYEPPPDPQKPPPKRRVPMPRMPQRPILAVCTTYSVTVPLDHAFGNPL